MKSPHASRLTPHAWQIHNGFLKPCPASGARRVTCSTPALPKLSLTHHASRFTDDADQSSLLADVCDCTRLQQTILARDQIIVVLALFAMLGWILYVLK